MHASEEMSCFRRELVYVVAALYVAGESRSPEEIERNNETMLTRLRELMKQTCSFFQNRQDLETIQNRSS